MTPSPSSSPGGSALLVSIALIASTLLLGACGDEDPPVDRLLSARDGAGPATSDALGGEDAFDSFEDELAYILEEAGEGRWRKARQDDMDTSAVDDETLEQLLAIGYASGSQQGSGRAGVVLNNEDGSAGGINFVLSGDRPEAVLMDMRGRVLHSWHKSLDELWPDHPRDKGQQSAMFWRRAFVYPNGDLLAMFDGLGLAKLDRNSQVIWARSIPVHHDLEVLPNGDIWVLTRVVRSLPGVARQVKTRDGETDESTNILEDFVTCLAPDGATKQHVSLIACLDAAEPAVDWVQASNDFWDKEAERDFVGTPADVYHTNSITVLEGRASQRAPELRAGHLLVSARHLDMVAVVDPASWKVVWSLTGATTLQHDPSITADGRMLVFDNQWQPGRSRAVAFAPESGAVAWEYGTADGQLLYSETCGAAQELPNGNVLITESDNGRALEVTPDGDIVWEYVNPRRAGDNDEYIATLFEVVRLPTGFGAAWLDAGD